MSHTGYALASLLAISILWVALFWLYRDYCVDLFRQRMFALRDELFNEAISLGIPCDHRSYGILRITMNGFIRFAHLFNLAHFLIVLVKFEAPENTLKPYSEMFEESMSGLTYTQESALRKIDVKMNELVIRHILLSSPLSVMTVVIPIALWIVLRKFLGAVLRFTKQPLEQMNNMAFVAGAD